MTAQQFRIIQELKAVKVSRYGLRLHEAKYLPNVIHPDEHIGGVVYGHNKDGVVMLIATDRRVIYLDRKPLFVQDDDITYDVISGVSFSHAGFGSTVTLHSKIKDYTIRTLNRPCAEQFVSYIDTRTLEHVLDGARQ